MSSNTHTTAIDWVKIPHGIVESVELPENLEENGYITREMVLPFSDPPGLVAVPTSVPPIPATGKSNDPNGHTLWITTAPSKARYFAKGWPKPVPKIPNKVVVKDTGGMGLGVFATRDIKRFEAVVIERPYMIFPKTMMGVSLTAKAQELTRSQLFQLTLMQAEKLLEKAMKESMTEEARKGYMELANSHTHDGSGPINGIHRTNSFSVNFGDKLPGFDQDLRMGYTGVSRIGSRFNHSCVPDVRVSFDAATFTMCFKARRDIKAGSQIFATYTDTLHAKAARQAALEPYGITECKCRACVNHSPQSDQLRQVYGKMIENWWRQSREVWPKDPKLNESILAPLLEIKKRVEEEGLDDYFSAYYPKFYFIMHSVYFQVGNMRKANELMAVIRRDMEECMKTQAWV